VLLWWAGLAYADIQWFGVEQSPALEKLQNFAKSAQGIVFPFVSYCTQYYVSNAKIQNGLELVEAYEQGFEGDNPARSFLLGTIGVWEPGELSSAPTDLPLSPSGQKALPTVSAALGPVMAKIDATRNVVCSTW
jgi:hypothetical protein